MARSWLRLLFSSFSVPRQAGREGSPPPPMEINFGSKKKKTASLKKLVKQLVCDQVLIRYLTGARQIQRRLDAPQEMSRNKTITTPRQPTTLAMGSSLDRKPHLEQLGETRDKPTWNKGSEHTWSLGPCTLCPHAHVTFISLLRCGLFCWIKSCVPGALSTFGEAYVLSWVCYFLPFLSSSSSSSIPSNKTWFYFTAHLLLNSLLWGKAPIDISSRELVFPWFLKKNLFKSQESM